MLKRYLQLKSYESKCLKILSKYFRRFSGPGELRRLLSHKIENETITQSHFVYLHRKFQRRSFYSFGGKVWTTRPSKIEKICVNPNYIVEVIYMIPLDPLNQSIEFNNLKSFCSICLYKMFKNFSHYLPVLKI